MLLQHYGLPVIVALNRFGSDTEREFEMIRKHLGEQGVEALVCEHFAKGSKGATNPQTSGESSRLISGRSPVQVRPGGPLPFPLSPSESYAAVRKLAVRNLTKPPPATTRICEPPDVHARAGSGLYLQQSAELECG